MSRINHILKRFGVFCMPFGLLLVLLCFLLCVLRGPVPGKSVELVGCLGVFMALIGGLCALFGGFQFEVAGFTRGAFYMFKYLGLLCLLAGLLLSVYWSYEFPSAGIIFGCLGLVALLAAAVFKYAFDKRLPCEPVTRVKKFNDVLKWFGFVCFIVGVVLAFFFRITFGAVIGIIGGLCALCGDLHCERSGFSRSAFYMLKYFGLLCLPFGSMLTVYWPYNYTIAGVIFICLGLSSLVVAALFKYGFDKRL